MPVAWFPDPREAGSEGIVAIGGDLHPDSLTLAYSEGIFPWPHRRYPLLWFSPDPRAVLDFDRLHIPERLARKRRNCGWTFTADTAFEQVLLNCQRIKRAGQSGTWLTPAMRHAYERLHERGDAHSIEAWDEDGELIGGLYGVTAGGYFSGESMFHLKSDASKLCVLHLIERLKEAGHTWIDIQIMTDHFAALGAREIPRDEFLSRIAAGDSRGSGWQ